MEINRLKEFGRIKLEFQNLDFRDGEQRTFLLNKVIGKF